MELTLEELLAECKKHGLTVVQTPKKELHMFTVIARYDRGLGPEYVTLQPVFAKTIDEAQELANKQAETFFATEEGFEKAVMNEVKIKPNE